MPDDRCTLLPVSDREPYSLANEFEPVVRHFLMGGIRDSKIFTTEQLKALEDGPIENVKAVAVKVEEVLTGVKYYIVTEDGKLVEGGR